MALSNDLIQQFVKATKDDTKSDSETTAYGTVVYNGKPYVRLDGSDLLTPVTTTVNVQDGERVTVTIKDHTATVTGNISSPAARTGDVEDIADQVTEFEIVMAHKVTTEELESTNALIQNLRVALAKVTDLEAVFAKVENLETVFADIEKLTANDITAIMAYIETLKADMAEFTDVSTEDLDAVNAAITNLKAYVGEFTYLSTEILDAVKADITKLDVQNLSSKEAELKYANIDFANISEAAINEFYAKSGIINSFIAEEGVVVKELVGVTINGDLIKAGTLVADKLVVRGSDGNYYKINTNFDDLDGVTPVEEDSIHGSTIVTNSIAAEKLSVSDLVAFKATIGGLHIKDDAIHSGVKESIDSTNTGFYMDAEGQMQLGGSAEHIKYYKVVDEETNEESYKLDIVADDVTIRGKGAYDVLSCINIDPDNNTITIGAGKSKMTLALKNDIIAFHKDGEQFGWWDGVDFHTGNIVINVTERAQFGNFAMVPRTDGSLSFLKVQ